MVSVVQPARVLLDPVDGVPAAVEGRRWVFPLLVLMLSSALSGAAFAMKLDPAPKVISQLEITGQLKAMPEAEVIEKITMAQRLELVAGVARGLFAMPFFVLLLAVAVKLGGWLLERSVKFGQAFTVSALAFLPVALFHGIFALSAMASRGVTESDKATLVPSSLAALGVSAGPTLTTVLPAIDFFNLWAVGLVGLGFAAASGMKRRYAFLWTVFMYALFVGVTTLGVGAFAGSGPGGPGR